MINRDREVLEALREDPELLAIADAVVETQKLSRPVGRRTILVVTLFVTALIVLVLALRAVS